MGLEFSGLFNNVAFPPECGWGSVGLGCPGPRPPPPPPPKGTLGYVTCAQAAGSTKRRKKMGSSGAYKTRGSFVSQNMGHEDACGWATEMQSSGYAAVRQWPTLSFTHRTCKFDLNSEFIRQETVMENSRLAAQRGHSTRCVPQTTVSPPPPPAPEGTLGYVTCAQAAGSTKRRNKMGSSVAYKTRGPFVSQE